MSGIALDAYTLEPQQGIVVGVHRADAPDSALATLPFERLTKTDDRGRFTLRGLKPIPYRLYALADLNNDARRDNPAELVAFYPKPITPTFEIATTIDTIWNLKAARVDTIVDREYVRYLPNNLLLSVFDEGYKPQYLTKYERPDSTFLRLTFNAPARRLPVLDFLGMDRPAYRLESSATLDTLTYWLADPRFIRADTLRLSLTYDITGADRRTIERTDTIMLTNPKANKPSASAPASRLKPTLSRLKKRS